ncbi:MAG: DUF4129 domain-containing protein [Anaerolineae bacterium]
MTKRKQLLWGVTLLTLGALVLLAAGLGQVVLFPEEREITLEALLAWLWQQYLQGLRAWESQTLPGGGEILFLGRVLLALALVLTPLSLTLLLLSPDLRKTVLREALRLTILFMAIQALVQARLLRGEPLFTFEGGGETPNLDLSYVPKAILEHEPRPSRWLVYGVSLLIALSVTYMAVRWGWQVARRKKQETPLQRLAREAQDAVDALQAEGDMRDVVTRCYADMTRVVQEARGLRRGREVTAREFEAYLDEQGLPAAPVHRLTRLFEAVRYGDHPPGEAERMQAMESLSAIAEACRRTT